MVLISSLLSLPPRTALERLATERTTLSEAVFSLSRRRDVFMLSDVSDAIIAEVDREADRLHLAIERLDLAETEILRREERADSTSATPFGS